jgi:hypothetical protein
VGSLTASNLCAEAAIDTAKKISIGLDKNISSIDFSVLNRELHTYTICLSKAKWLSESWPHWRRLRQTCEFPILQLGIERNPI